MMELLHGWYGVAVRGPRCDPQSSCSPYSLGEQFVSLLFFGLQNPGTAFLEIVLLWAAISVTTFLFWRNSALAAMLMMPYLLWVSFASFLNYTIWTLNPV